MNPKGQHLFEIYTALSSVRVASYTSHTLPCLNTKQVAVKVISKVQQPLISMMLKLLKKSVSSIGLKAVDQQSIRANSARLVTSYNYLSRVQVI